MSYYFKIIIHVHIEIKITPRKTLYIPTDDDNATTLLHRY